MEDSKDVMNQMIVLTNKMETIKVKHGAVGSCLRDTNHTLSSNSLGDSKKTKNKKKLKKDIKKDHKKSKTNEKTKKNKKDKKIKKRD